MAENFEQTLAHVNTYSKPSDLRITDMRFVDIVGAPMHCTLLRIETNQGITGYGEVRDGASKLCRVLALLLPGPQVLALCGLVLVGLGCAPIYPSIIHSTPEHFGTDRSQAVIGIQMASAYVGNLAMPPLFGLLANNITPALFPFYLLALLVLMVFMHEQLVRKTSRC